MKHETDEQIRVRAAAAYNKYQNCGLKSANNLFATGW
jgi:phage-related baseplate assembly protein